MPQESLHYYGDDYDYTCVASFEVPDLSPAEAAEECGFFDFGCEDDAAPNVLLSGLAAVALGLTVAF